MKLQDSVGQKRSVGQSHNLAAVNAYLATRKGLI